MSPEHNPTPMPYPVSATNVACIATLCCMSYRGPAHRTGAGGHPRNADNHATMVVELEFGANVRILQLVELRVLHGNEGILGNYLCVVTSHKVPRKPRGQCTSVAR